MSMNTSTQNEQQLKNFDLSEYRYNRNHFANLLSIFSIDFNSFAYLHHRQVVYSTIVGTYENTVQQMQEVLKNHIVAAILEHDEMARGKNKGTFFAMVRLDNLSNSAYYIFRQKSIWRFHRSQVAAQSTGSFL